MLHRIRTLNMAGNLIERAHELLADSDDRAAADRLREASDIRQSFQQTIDGQRAIDRVVAVRR